MISRKLAFKLNGAGAFPHSKEASLLTTLIP